ncbi:angiopoietin-related protein 3-like isoform X1 [Zeugodacus cucurbitae]|uniref:angiopoietin-related protein 3-like isoform X1 n=1 Tax=Zeugodacus cucurbitae TaxID=28588 RepID=UPI0023D933BB|nr:angiopoietin-related protein 3-like isoform X1 [Zeugodacus cucurbitae]
MMLSDTVRSLVLLAILLVPVSTEAVDEISARNNSTNLRRTLRNRMRNPNSTVTSNLDTNNAVRAVNKRFDTDRNRMKDILKNDEANLNETKLNDNSTDVERESRNNFVNGLENVGDGSKAYRDVELKSNGAKSINISLASIAGGQKTFENQIDISKNATESKSDNTTISKSGIENENDNPTISKSDRESKNDNTTISKSNIQSENDNLTNATSEYEVGNVDIFTSSLKTKTENKNETKISKTVTASGGNRMSELRSKFLSGLPNRNIEPTNASTIVIGPKQLDDFKTNFQNSPKFRDTIFEPVLTTVIKTKSILKDDTLVTVTEKSFLFYRDQTELPNVSKVTNTTIYKNTERFEGAENNAKTMRFIPDPFDPSEIFASKRGGDENLPGSCAELMKQNVDISNGVATIYVLGYGPTDVYCFADPTGTGCAWTVFMRRVNIGDSFNRNWQEYKQGFGDPDQSFFLGLDRIYAQTSDRRQELGIFTKFESNDIEVEKYVHFVLGGEETGYRVEELGAFSKTSAICRLTRFSKFSTQDVDNGFQYDKCAQALGMGWWYSKRCKNAIKLSGVRAYINAPTIMGIRPRGCQA